MKRQRLDSISLETIQSIADMDALARTNYAGSLRIAKLYALLSVAMQLQLSIALQKDSNDNRAVRLANKTIEMHLTGIRKRIVQVEAINERKASRFRRDRAMGEVVEIITRASALSKIAKLSPERSAGLPPIPAAQRAQIAAPIIAEITQPEESTDEAYNRLIEKMNKAVESSNSNSDDTAAYGSAEDWIKP